MKNYMKSTHSPSGSISKILSLVFRDVPKTSFAVSVVELSSGRENNLPKYFSSFLDIMPVVKLGNSLKNVLRQNQTVLNFELMIPSQ